MLTFMKQIIFSFFAHILLHLHKITLFSAIITKNYSLYKKLKNSIILSKTQKHDVIGCENGKKLDFLSFPVNFPNINSFATGWLK